MHFKTITWIEKGMAISKTILWCIKICRRVYSYGYSPILIDFRKWHWHLVFQTDIMRLHWKFMRIDFHFCVLQSERVWPWTSISDLKGHNDQSMLSNKWWRSLIKWLSQNFASFVTSVADDGFNNYHSNTLSINVHKNI